MSVPSHPFELLIFNRDGKCQWREFATIATAVEAVKALRPRLHRNYRLSIVLAAQTLKDDGGER
jgi:hypothetical protein